MDSERRSQRYPSQSPLQLRCETWTEFVDTYASDVCRGGMFIRTDDAPEVLSQIEIRLILPEGTEIALSARVVHVVTPEQSEAYGRPAGMGVEFIHADAEQKRQILQLVEFARNQGRDGADPNASFTRTLLETSTSMPARDVAARLSMLPDAAVQDTHQAVRKQSRMQMPAVQVPDGAETEHTGTAHAVRPPPRGASAQIDPDVFRAAAQRQIVRAPTGPVTPNTARSSTNIPAVRGPSAPIDPSTARSTTKMPAVRAPSAPLHPPTGRSSTNIPIVRAPSAPLDPSATSRSSMNNAAVRPRPPSAPIVRAQTGPVGNPGSNPARAASGPISGAPDTTSGMPQSGSGPAPSPSGQPQTPPKPTDVNRLKLVMNALAHKHFDDAARMAREMLADNPGDPQVLKWQAVCFARMALARNDANAAAEQYEKVLRYEENNREAREFVRTYQRDRKLNSLPFGRYFTKKK